MVMLNVVFSGLNKPGVVFAIWMSELDFRDVAAASPIQVSKRSPKTTI